MDRFWLTLSILLLAGCSNASKLIPSAIVPSLFTSQEATSSATVSVARWPLAKLAFFTTQQSGNYTSFLFYVFFPNGECYRQCPRGGFDTFKLYEIKPLENGNCGTYRVDNSNVTMYFPTGEIVLARDSALGYLDGNGLRYYRIRKPSFEKLSGHYYKTTDETRTLSFTEKGEFTANAGAWHSIDANYLQKEGVGGHYTIAGNTLILVPSGAAAIRTTFFTDPSDPATNSTKLIYIDHNAFTLK